MNPKRLFMASGGRRTEGPPGGGRMPGPAGRMMGPRIERAKDVRGAVRRLLGYLRAFRKRLVFVVGLAALGTSMALLGPLLMGQAIDLVVDGRGSGALVSMVLLMLGAYGLSWLADLAQGWIMAGVAQRAMFRLRDDLFAHVQTLPMRFFDRRPYGELMSRLTNDMDAISRVLSQSVTQLFSSGLTLIGVLAVMFALNPWLALGSMLVFPMMMGLVGFVARRTRTSFRGYQRELGALNGLLEETYGGQKVVLAFGRQDDVLRRFREANAKVRQLGIYAQSYALLVPPMMGILANANVAVIAGLGGWMTVQGLATVGTIAAFITYSRRFAQPLRMLGDLYNQIQAAVAGAERVFEVLDEPPEPEDAALLAPRNRARGEVLFDSVTFAYDPGQIVLKDVSLHARPGEIVALVGPTGAGKTTIVNLLSRFYDLDRGSIRVDGRDIRDVARGELRRQLGVVLQQTFMFSESVLANIRYGRPEATEAEVEEAARLVGADVFVRRLPDGYHTRLAERGENLSQGQRQLIAIARAVLAAPQILVLDEATSSVDTRTEAQLQRALRTLMEGRTSFVIAHRLSTIRNADQVLVIQDGRIVEQGTHDVLLASGGAYHRLYMSQFRGVPAAQPVSHEDAETSQPR